MMDFLKKKKFLENGKSSKFVVEIAWNSEISQNDHHLIFSKNSKCIIFSVECERSSKTSPKLSKFGFFQKEKVFLIEKLIVFTNAECCKLPVECDWNSNVSQNVKICVSWKKYMDFSKIKHEIFKKC